MNHAVNTHAQRAANTGTYGGTAAMHVASNNRHDIKHTNQPSMMMVHDNQGLQQKIQRRHMAPQKAICACAVCCTHLTRSTQQHQTCQQHSGKRNQHSTVLLGCSIAPALEPSNPPKHNKPHPQMTCSTVKDSSRADDASLARQNMPGAQQGGYAQIATRTHLCTQQTQR